jgi:hypothetical protein
MRSEIVIFFDIFLQLTTHLFNRQRRKILRPKTRLKFRYFLRKDFSRRYLSSENGSHCFDFSKTTMEL